MCVHVLRVAEGQGSRSAFSRTDLLMILTVLALLGFVWFPALGRSTGDSEDLECLNNLRQILLATVAYTEDSNGFLPHPTVSEFQGWAYAPRNDGGFPDAPTAIPDLSGQSGPYVHTNQLPFFKMGQLARYLDDQQTMVCPVDWALSMGEPEYQDYYTARRIKLTSYSMSDVVVRTSTATLRPGLTHRLSAFPGHGILFWGTDETHPGAFSDAAGGPLSTFSYATRRHLRWSTVEGQTSSVGSMVGRFDGSVDFVTRKLFDDFPYNIPRPNDLLCGPAFE